MILNKIDKLFLENPDRMRMGKGKLSMRYGVTESQIESSRKRVRKLMEAASATLTLPKQEVKRKRLFFDIETSANIVFSWRIGRDVMLQTHDIIQERAIICICWKWEGDATVHSLEWNKGCDKKLLKDFCKIIDGADEVVTQNGDAFDIKWVRGRAIKHGIQLSPKFNSIDTLKMARAGFKFNSNKLDYMGHYLGIGQKIKTEFNLWKDITLSNCPKAMGKMVKYCKRDVTLLEDVYNKLQPYCPVKKFKYK